MHYLGVPPPRGAQIYSGDSQLRELALELAGYVCNSISTYGVVEDVLRSVEVGK